MNLQQLPNDQIPIYAKGIAEAFHDAEEALQAYSDGKFVYRDLPSLTKVGEGYGEALIPEAYVQEHWLPVFGGACVYLAPAGFVDQATIILKKSKSY